MKVQMDVGGTSVSLWTVEHVTDFSPAILSTLVQLFYGFRIYTISNKSLVFPVIIVRDVQHVDVSQTDSTAGSLRIC
jgi:hypothetical protein